MLINFLRWDATYFFLSSADDTLRLTADRLNGDVNDVDAPVRLLLSVAETPAISNSAIAHATLMH